MGPHAGARTVSAGSSPAAPISAHSGRVTLTMPPVHMILDDPEIVLTRKDGVATLIGVWHGGVTFDVYTDEPSNDDGEWREVEHFEHSDSLGQSLDAEDARESLREALERLAFTPA